MTGACTNVHHNYADCQEALNDGAQVEVCEWCAGFATVAGRRIVLPEAFTAARAMGEAFVYTYERTGDVVEWHWKADREEWQR